MPKRIVRRMAEFYHGSSIRYTIFISFTAIALIALVFTGLLMYARFSDQLETNRHSESQILVEQANQSLNLTISNMIRLSNTLSYQVIKNNDVTTPAVLEQMQILYDANSSYIENIALFSSEGELLAAAPPAIVKDYVDVSSCEWFQQALLRPEDVHLSAPAVQNLFIDADNQYRWTLSISCVSEITQDKSVTQGVVLIDLKYSSISQILRSITLANNGYVYLIDSDGSIVYHPKQQLMATGFFQEADPAISDYRDGEYTMSVNGNKSTIIVRSVGYTGWKAVGVIPQMGLYLDASENIQYLMIIVLAFFMFTVFLNAVLSDRLTVPIKRLDDSVRRMEQNMDNTDIYVGGSHEIQHLGRSIQRMVNIRRNLTDAIVQEQVQKQKSELNVLQSQINPHFLYNTLDIIVWTIEKGKHDEALRVVSALGRFFRISLSKGKFIITVRDEIEHVRNYLMIQQVRYRSKFEYRIEADEDTLELTTIKLVLQPIVENAIYHSMDYMTDGEGEIVIRSYIEDGSLYLSVRDNGLGIPPQVVDRLLRESSSTTKGSGIGLKNVNERIVLYFGEEYGILIESEPDVGTLIRIRLPILPYKEADDNK